MEINSIIPEKLNIAQYRFTLRAEQTISIPDYAGSMLRGAFGHALRVITCITKQSHCKQCPVATSCLYQQLFEPQTTHDNRTIPAPYIYIVPINTKAVIQQGEEFQFSINLFGHAIQHLNLIIFAWQKAAKDGLGESKKSASLIKVEYVNPNNLYAIDIFTTENPVILEHETYLSTPTILNSNQTQLEILTPTRIQYQGGFCNSHNLTVEIFLISLARKIQLYAKTYLDLNLTPPPLPEAISLQKNTTVYKWNRYSNRQQQKMAMDGLIGTLTFQGDLTEWLPWLWLGQFTHIGKNTAFGLGQYRLVN